MNLKQPWFLIIVLFSFLFLPLQISYAQQTSPPVSSADAEAASSDRTAESFDFADGLYARDMFDMAAQEYQTLIQAHPSHPRSSDALYRLAESLFMLGRYPEALQRYKEFLQQVPEHAQAGAAKLRQAEAFYQLGNTQEALDAFAALEESPDAFIRNTAYFFSGRIHYEQKDFSKAEPLLRKIETSGEDNAYAETARYYLGKIMLEKGLFDEAFKLFESLNASSDPQIKTLGLFGLGEAAFLSKDYARAADAFHQVAQSGQGSSELRGDAQLNYWKALYETGGFQKIADSYETAASVKPMNSLSFMLLAANSYYRLERYDDTVKTFDAILTLPGLSEEHRETAELGKIEALLAAGKAAEALEISKGMLQERSFYKDRWAFLMADALRRTGNFPEALGLYDTFIENFSDSEYLPQVLLHRAQALLQAGPPEQARDALDRFLRTYPDHAFAKAALMNRIALDVRLESWQEAVISSNAFLEKFGEEPEAADIHFQLGSVYLQQKDYASAYEIFEKHLQDYQPAGEKKQETIFFLGYAKQLAGDMPAAVEHYRRMNPDETAPELLYAALKNLAYAYVRQDKLDEAADVYREMITRFPEKMLGEDVYFWLADYYLRKEDGQAIFEVLKPITKTAAENESLELNYYLAEAHRLSAQAAEALTYYDKALLLMQDTAAFEPNIRLGKGRVLAALGRLEEAQAELEGASKTAADDYALAMRARLELADVYAAQDKPLEAGKSYMAVAILYDDPAVVPEALTRAVENFEKAGRTADAAKAYEELKERYPDHPLPQKPVPAAAGAAS